MIQLTGTTDEQPTCQNRKEINGSNYESYFHDESSLSVFLNIIGARAAGVTDFTVTPDQK